ILEEVVAFVVDDDKDWEIGAGLGRRFASLWPGRALLFDGLSASTVVACRPRAVHDDAQFYVSSNGRAMSALGHVWTAPWQELSDVAAALVGCGHVSGLFVRRIWPLALMLCADRVPIESTHFKVR